MKQKDARIGSEAPAVSYLLGESTLDTVLVAQTPKGVCALFMGEDSEALESALRELYPNARRADARHASPNVKGILSEVIAFIDAPAQELDIALDLHGTDFQRRVWQALRQVPLGQRATYAEIARAIGRPTASRAVAGACAANRVSLAVPCHRIVRSDGGLSGYRWGVARKRALLEREAAARGQQLIFATPSHRGKS